jgi:hypothetical protein
VKNRHGNVTSLVGGYFSPLSRPRDGRLCGLVGVGKLGVEALEDTLRNAGQIADLRPGDMGARREGGHENVEAM